MNKLLLLSFICLPGFFACQYKKTKHYSYKKIADTYNNYDLDTSLISLKSFSAKPLNEALSQLWKMDDVTQKYWNKLFWDSVANKRKYPELALYKDFSATENARCKIRMGKWEVDKKHRELLLSFDDGTHKTYFVQKILLQKMVVSQRVGEDDVVLDFSSDGIVHGQIADDPFYPANNLWRIKPKSPETHEQIVRRVKQCVHFYSLFFQDNHQRGATDISFIGLPNCFEWYNGGIGLPNKSDLDKNWIDCFYSEQDAMKGYQLLETIIENHDLKWPEHPTSWIKQTHEVLDQIDDKL